MAEAGYPKVVFMLWVGLLAPAGTPADIVARLNAEINEAMKTPELAASMRKLGFEPTIWSPRDYAAFLAEEAVRWPAIVQASGVKAE
jgi:tripartite-type tricarboxylate transporter receptor subunit TctC